MNEIVYLIFSFSLIFEKFACHSIKSRTEPSPSVYNVDFVNIVILIFLKILSVWSGYA